MTKKEIYDQIVELTTEIQKTGFAKDLFDLAIAGESKYVKGVIDSFRSAFPELNKRIIDFGQEFNSLVGESYEEKKIREEINRDCLTYMYTLLQDDIITKIYNALRTKDPFEIEDAITAYVKGHQTLSHELLVFQKKFNKVINNGKTGCEGEIFGDGIGVYSFDISIIDPLSFCALMILSNIDEVFLFDVDSTSFENYIKSLENLGYVRLASFCSITSFPDWIEDNSEELVFPNIEELLVAIFNGDLDEVF